MSDNGAKPTAVSVIGWGAVVVGVLMLFSAAMGALAFSMMPEAPDLSGREMPSGIAFLFRHFDLLALVQFGCGILMIFAGRALLGLRRWGAIVIEVFAALLLLYTVGFTMYFAVEVVGGFPGADRRPPGAFVAMMIVMAVFTMLFWATPMILTIYHLRKEPLRRLLR